MADHFFLSLWLKQYDETKMLDFFRLVLETFPYSKARPRIRSLTVYPLNWNEHPVLEEDFSEGGDIPYTLGLASDFLHTDYAYEATAFWDLWVFQKNGGPGGWKELPRLVSLSCFGPGFEEGRAERGHIEIDFGLDTPFRADQRTPDIDARKLALDYRERLQANIRKLLEFVKRLTERLPIEKKLLWTESGESFAELIKQSLK